MPLHPLKGLLSDALLRSRIGKQVLIANTIRHADAFLDEHLPEELRGTAKAVSLSEGILLVGCMLAPVCGAVEKMAEDLLAFVKQKEPRSPALRIRIRLVASAEGVE
ncbi:hypothetical protein HYV73_03740 [Candidatus Uhrbacteria bacterium]|nr:hypothetical protein [Candidatus Uhrbacteria bacterium]